MPDLWAAIGGQLKHPAGLGGRVTARLMRLANARANAMAVAALDPRPAERFAELGCGPGRALKLILANAGVAHVLGVDHSALMIKAARRANADAVKAGRLWLHRGDFTSLPLTDRCLDGVLGVNVAYFMADARAAAEAFRVLKPGGRLVLYATAAEAMRNWRFAGPHSHRLFSVAEIRDMLAGGGFAAGSVKVEERDAGFGVTGLLAVAVRRGGQGG